MNVLLVEDHEDTREILGAVVRYCKHKAIPAGTCAEALRLLESGPVDVLVCDLNLPDCDGLSLVAKAKKFRPQIRTIALTARASDKDREAGITAGFDYYFTKPLEGHKLRSLLCNELGPSSEKGSLRAA